MSKYLFLIAIDEYHDAAFPNLNNAKLDVQRFANVLTEKFNFELVTDILTDELATRKSIIEELNLLSTIITEQDDLIIFFAGHGEKHGVTDKGFWIPSNATQSVSDFIPNSTIIDTIEGINAKHILLISDSCFSGTLLTQTRSGTGKPDLAKIKSLKSRWLFTSGREEKVSDGEPGVGSPFALAICEYLEKQNAPILATELFNHVIRYTGKYSKQQAIAANIEKCGHEGGILVFESSESPKNEKSELEKLTVTYETGLKLKKSGIPQNGIFSYFKYSGGRIVKLSSESGDNLCSAFMSQELHDMIPDMIQIDENTFLAHTSGYDQLTKDDVYEFQYAEVLVQKTMLESDPFMAICRCNGRMVAFSKTKDGKYRNLIRFGKNQAEAIGEMVLALNSEGKLEK